MRERSSHSSTASTASSCQAASGLLKPDAAIYYLFLDRHGLKAADCIFIDDSAANVAGAQAVGMHGHHFVDAEGLARELRAHGFDV